MVIRQLGPGAGVRAALSPADIEKLVEKTARGYSGMLSPPTCRPSSPYTNSYTSHIQTSSLPPLPRDAPLHGNTPAGPRGRGVGRPVATLKSWWKSLRGIQVCLFSGSSSLTSLVVGVSFLSGLLFPF
jgi:hypothetical protein